MTKVVKAGYLLVKWLSYDCRYLDDICTINLVTLPKAYMTTHCYWKVVSVVTDKTYLWIFVSVLLITNLYLVSIIKLMI